MMLSAGRRDDSHLETEGIWASMIARSGARCGIKLDSYLGIWIVPIEAEPAIAFAADQWPPLTTADALYVATGTLPNRTQHRG